MPERGNLYTFIFAVIVCIFCSIVLALASTALKPYQDDNARLYLIKNLCIVAGYSAEEIEKKNAQEIIDLFEKEFKPVILDRENQSVARNVIEQELTKLNYKSKDLAALYTFELLALFQRKKKLLAEKKKIPLNEYDPGYKSFYKFSPQGKIKSYIVPVAGPGLWDMIYGYIALDTDLNSVKGITFYEHKETPGLGGECEKAPFRNQFIGKKIFDKKNRFRSITVAKGKASVTVKGDELDHYVDGMSGATLTGKGINLFLKKDIGKFVDYFQAIRARQGERGSGKSEKIKENPTKGGAS